MNKLLYAVVATSSALIWTVPAAATTQISPIVYTQITAGSYSAGDNVSISGSVGLGVGTYRFILTLSSAVDAFEGQVQKITNYVEYCDMDGSGTAVYCGSDDYPTIPFLEPHGSNEYQAWMRVDAPHVEYNPDGIGRTEYSDDCCTYSFNFNAIGSGTFSFVYELIPEEALPEPATWMMMILGFALIGGATRQSPKAIYPRSSVDGMTALNEQSS